MNVEAVSSALDARTAGVHFFDERTNERSVRALRLQFVTGVKRIQSYFAETGVIFKGFLCLFEGSDVLEKPAVEVDVYFITGNLEIFEFASHHGDESFWFASRMF